MIAICALPAIAAPPHPLDPLTTDELAILKTVLESSGAFSTNTYFAWIELQEPPKELVKQYVPNAPIPRMVHLSALDYERKTAFSVTVDLRARRIASLADLKDLQPGFTERDNAIATEILNNDTKVSAALSRRGLKIPGRLSNSVKMLYETIGNDPSLSNIHGRLMRVLFLSDQKAANEFSPVVDGVMAIVDLYGRRVVRLVEDPGEPIEEVPHDVFSRAVRGGDPQPVSQVLLPQPKSSDHIIDGNLIRWQNWRFRVGFNLREGLVLYDVGYEDRGRIRSILYRASVAEVFTLYGDTAPRWAWMGYFDEASFGLGYSAVPVQSGREVPANAKTISVTTPNPAKSAFADAPANLIYLYERDGGTLEYYQQGGRTLSARSTELVVGFVASLGNYAYALEWIFRQDGSFAFEATLAGEIFTKFAPADECQICGELVQGPGAAMKARTFRPNADERNATLVYKNLVGMNHQHWFALRMNFDIDGDRNAVVENNVVRDTRGDRNGGFLTVEHTIFGRAEDAKRDVDHEHARTWTIYNPQVVNRYGRPSGYDVMPMGNAMTALPTAYETGPAAFTFHHLWVTPYRDGERFPDGMYPTNAGPAYDDTIYHFAGADLIFDRDIVVWYILGTTHIPRPEDYPLMPNMRTSVEFRPNGFFERNPALSKATESR